MPEPQIRVLIVDDQVLLRGSLRVLIESEPDLTVVGEAGNGAEAVELAEKACEQTQNKDPMTMGTLAAAYAEAARFPEAIATAEKAADLAATAGNAPFAAINRQLLQLYRAGKPYHEKPRSARNP